MLTQKCTEKEIGKNGLGKILVETTNKNKFGSDFNISKR